MIGKFNRVINNKFVRNVLIIATGTVSAQILTILCSPIITRLYGPEAFGALGVFNALVNIISPIVALSYPIAIVLPKEERDARLIALLSLLVSIILSLASFILIISFGSQIVEFFNLHKIEDFVILIPIVIFFSSILQVFEQWLIRTNRYKKIANVNIIHSLIMNGGKIGVGIYNSSSVILISIAIVGIILKALLMTIGSKIKLCMELVRNIRFDKILKIAKDYRDFPFFRSPQIFINTLTQSLPLLLLTAFFGPLSAGFYTLCKSVISLPVQLLGKSVGDVFYPRITEAANNNKEITTTLIKTTLGLCAIGILPFGVICLFGPWIFSSVFGLEWYRAGQYSVWIAVWQFFVFLSRPSITAIPVLKLQAHFLIYEICSTFIRIGSLIFGIYYFDSDIKAVMLFSLMGAISILLIIIYVIIKSQKKPNRSEEKNE